MKLIRDSHINSAGQSQRKTVQQKIDFPLFYLTAPLTGKSHIAGWNPKGKSFFLIFFFSYSLRSTASVWSGLPKGLMASDIRLVLHAPLVNLISSKMEELSACPPPPRNDTTVKVRGVGKESRIITLFCSVHALIWSSSSILICLLIDTRGFRFTGYSW